MKRLIILLLLATSCSTTRQASIDDRRGLMLLEPHELTGNKKFSKRYRKVNAKRKYKKRWIQFFSIYNTSKTI